jgi:hypothetical protein
VDSVTLHVFVSVSGKRVVSLQADLKRGSAKHVESYSEYLAT